jgi:hypothetical protein
MSLKGTLELDAAVAIHSPIRVMQPARSVFIFDLSLNALCEWEKNRG